jgi:hypothetical protein
MKRFALILVFAVAFWPGRAADRDPKGLTEGERILLEHISADSMKGHVSFLASDLLEGRDTPSRGLDIAAEYIAAHFRGDGLEPAGDDGYYQTARYVSVIQPMDGFEVTVEHSGHTIHLGKDKAFVQSASATDLHDVLLWKVVPTDEEAIGALTEEQIQGKALLIDAPDPMSMSDEERQKLYPRVLRARKILEKLKPALVLMPGRSAMSGSGRLREASSPAPDASPVVITVTDEEFRKFIKAAKPGPVAGSVTAKIPGPIEEPVTLKNVIGLLRGSDPELKSTYVLITAHYDHIGMLPWADPDRINNGANDDASGTSSVLELASAFSKGPRPRRSIVFMTYFGEEKGLLGSRYYGRKPIFPLAQTVANLNLEHMGRTDDLEGPHVGKITASGFDYTSIGDLLKQAGELTGVTAWHDPKNSDAFFPRSDNQALADVGIPAITLAVSWIFPDYHRVGDHWDKLDYANMEKVDRTVALTIERIANDPMPPSWIESNSKTAKYLKAARELHQTQ